MKFPFSARAPTFDAAAIKNTIQRALASAGIDTASGPMRDVTETIHRALASGKLAGDRPVSKGPDTVIEVEARVIHPETAHEAESIRDTSTPRPQASGTFTTHQYSNGAGTRAYKLYVPSPPTNAPRPLVVMLHGCTQSADDFAIGTQMNRLAQEHGLLVVYPEQTGQANMSKCWNWFSPADQARDAGEPSLIAGIVREVAARHHADPRRMFVGGLSAGAAMAVVLGEAYPELFAGVCAHSGLPFGSAHDIPSAMAAMKGGRSGLPGLRGAQGAVKKAVQPVPLIVFHGDRDHTVQQSNGKEIVKQALDAYRAQEPGAEMLCTTEDGQSAGGRRYSRTVHASGQGRGRIEYWDLHGAAHAWSGGDARGTYTDGAGPDASAEMVRFFLSLPRAGSA